MPAFMVPGEFQGLTEPLFIALIKCRLMALVVFPDDTPVAWFDRARLQFKFGCSMIIDMQQFERGRGAPAEEIDRLTALWARYHIIPYIDLAIVTEAGRSSEYQQLYMDKLARYAPAGDVLLTLAAEMENRGGLRPDASACAIRDIAARTQNTVARVTREDILDRLNEAWPVLHLVGAMRHLQQRRGPTPFLPTLEEFGEFLAVAAKLQRFLQIESGQPLLGRDIGSLWLLADEAPDVSTLPAVHLVYGATPSMRLN